MSWDIRESEAGTAEIWHEGVHVGYITHKETTTDNNSTDGSAYERRRYLVQAREVRSATGGQYRIMRPVLLSTSFLGTASVQEDE